jgi:tol-pal system-associated acyl-CoA thioesterase
VNYLKFMERARTEFMRSLGLDRQAIFNDALMFVVGGIALDYRAPARLDEDLHATASVTRLGGASLELWQRVRRGSEVLVEGTVTIACVDPATLKPRRIPRDMLAKLRGASPSSGD